MNGTQSLPRMWHLLILLYVLLCSTFTLSFSKLCNPDDEKILLQFKAESGSFSNLLKWTPKTDCCSDWGMAVQCNSDGRVIELILGLVIRGIEYTGTISPVIGQLPFLQTLYLWNRNIHGPIPSSICNLTHLGELQIMQTNMSGHIPNCFHRQSPLSIFYVQDNPLLTGPIPDSMANLTNLQWLLIPNNHFSGTIPNWLHKLPSLNKIDLSNNRFSGPIPDIFGSFQYKGDLQLDMHGNRLSGPIPNSLGQLNVGSLDLSDNRLTGEPTFLYGRNNTIPFVNLSKNRLKYDASKMLFPPALRGLNISHNMVYGTLPRQLGQMRLGYIDVSYNQLCGPIPTGRRLNQVDPIYFSHNKCLCGRPLPPCKLLN